MRRVAVPAQGVPGGSFPLVSSAGAGTPVFLFSDQTVTPVAPAENRYFLFLRRPQSSVMAQPSSAAPPSSPAMGESGSASSVPALRLSLNACTTPAPPSLTYTYVPPAAAGAASAPTAPSTMSAPSAPS